MEEREAWARWHGHQDADARTWLIEHYRRLAVQVARGWAFVKGPDRDDLRGAALLALVQAVDQWRPELTPSFEQFVVFKMRAGIVNHLRQMGWAKKGVRRTARDLDAAWDIAAQQHGRAPRTAEVAAVLGVTEDELAQLESQTWGTGWQPLSLDVHREGDHGETPELAEIIPDPNSRTPEEHALLADRLAALHEILERLPEREQQVIRWRYLEERPQKWIAQQLQVHASRISQIVDAALARARELAQQLPLALPTEEVSP